MILDMNAAGWVVFTILGFLALLTMWNTARNVDRKTPIERWGGLITAFLYLAMAWLVTLA